MSGQRPFLCVVDAPSQTWEDEHGFSMELETNMHDPNATVDITASFEPIADCVHQQCRLLKPGFFHASLHRQETRGRRGAKRKQQFNFDCELSGAWHKCSVWRIVCRLSLPTRDADGNITGRRHVAKTTHTLTHRNTPNPESKSGFSGARAFTVTESLTTNGQRPWLRVVEAPTIVHCSEQDFPVTLETNIMDPEVEIEHVSRDCDGEDYDNLDLYPDQWRLDWGNEFLLYGYFRSPTTHGKNRNATRQFKMNGTFDMVGHQIDDCDSWRVIFTLSKEGKTCYDREVLAVASHIITRAPRE